MISCCFLDWFGVTIAGATEPLVEILVAEARDGGAGGEATLVGRTEKVSLLDAVLINGAASHALDYDDGNAEMQGHPSVVLVPGLLAVASRRKLGGARVIEAYAAGYEAGVRIGRLLGRNHYQSGFHGTATVGSFAAAAAVGRLLELDAATMARAFGIAGTRAAGLRASFGTMCKPLHAGHAAWVGTTAARLAARGFSANSAIFEADYGFGPTHSAGLDIAAALAEAPQGNFVSRNIFKWHAACYGTHATIETVLRLVRDDGITGDHVDRMLIRVPENLKGMCSIAEPETGLEMKFSLRMVAAMVLAGIDTADPASFSNERTRDRSLIALRDRLSVEFAGSDEPCELRLVTRDGRSIVRHAGAVSDDTSRVAGLTAKFDALATPPLGRDRARQLRDYIAMLPRHADIDRLLEFSVPA